MHQYDLVSRTGDDRPAFLPSARGRGPPATPASFYPTNVAVFTAMTPGVHWPMAK